MEVVKRRSIYGYWTDDKVFIKVFLNDPMDKSRLAIVLEVRIIYGENVIALIKTNHVDLGREHRGNNDAVF